MSKVKIAATIPLCFLKEKDSFIAFSPALDLSTCGRTFNEAKKNFSAALEIFFEECISMGTLNEVLASCGWEKDRKKGWEPPTYIGESRIELPNLATA
jgi:predicted RNase H-like HicB family nuclease